MFDADRAGSLFAPLAPGQLRDRVGRHAQPLRGPGHVRQHGRVHRTGLPGVHGAGERRIVVLVEEGEVVE